MHQLLHDFLIQLPLTDSAMFFLPKIIVALICGTIIGLERELFNKTAGMKTLMLVCLGSTLFAALSIYLGTGPDGTHVDKTRIMAQIVTGIGFLGAGVILQQKGGVIGMTSAANIWFTGAVGCIIGIGEYELAILLCFISVFFLVTFRWLEIKIGSVYESSIPHIYHLKIECDPEADVYIKVQDVIRANSGIMKHGTLKKQGVQKVIDIRYSCSPRKHEAVIKRVQEIKGIISLELDEYTKES